MLEGGRGIESVLFGPNILRENAEVGGQYIVTVQMQGEEGWRRGRGFGRLVAKEGGLGRIHI